MWLLTNFGMFSIVEKYEQKGSGQLTVRARVKADLVELHRRYLPEMGEIQTGGGTDYAYRAVASRTAVARAFSQALLDLDYDNFKDSVALKQGHERAATYSKVWSILRGLQK